MTSEEVKRRVAAIEKVGREAARTPETALAFLVKAGIMTKSGNLTKPYRSNQPSMRKPIILEPTTPES